MPYLDNFSNFAKCTVSIGYDSAATTIVLSSGEGSKLPSTPTYNLVWWNATDYADPSDDPLKEIVRTAGRTGDTLTVQRAQESTSAQNHNVAGKAYKMALTLTAKTMVDIETKIVNLEKSGFYASRITSNQAIPTGVDTKVQFQSVDFDLATEYDSATNFRFTATKKSVYQVSAALTFAGITASNSVRLRLKTTGGAVICESYMVAGPAGGGNQVQPMIAVAVQLLAGDILEVYANQGDGADRNVEPGKDKTWFSAVAAGIYQRQ